MNLGQIRAYCNNILDYSPNVQTYIDEVNEVINEVYLTHFQDRVWEYAQKEVKLHLYADVTGSYEGQANGLFRHGTGLQEGWVGHGHIAEVISTVTTPSNTLIEAGQEYFVSYREDSGGRTEVSLEVLGRQGYGQYSTAEKKVIEAIQLQLKFKQRHIVMPQDCIEVLGVGLRNRQSGIRSPFYVLPKYMDEHMALDLDLVAIPTDVIITQPVSIQQPHTPPTISVISTRANTVPATGDYEIAYTLVHRAQTDSATSIVELESAPVYSAGSFALTAGTSVEASGLSITDTSPQTVFNDARKYVYIKGPDSEHFYRAADLSGAEEQSTFNNTDGLLIEPSSFISAAKLPEHGGTYATIRLYPRQDADYEANFRYHFRPAIMRDDTDTPQMPADAHLYLAYRSCEELFMKHGNTVQAQAYKAKADKELLNLENRYLTTKAATHIKGPYKVSSAFMGRPQITITRR